MSELSQNEQTRDVAAEIDLLSDSDSPALGVPAVSGECGTLGRRYRVVRQLGQGGMGAVYLGFDTDLDRPVALKVMLPRIAALPTARERFLREARAAAKVHSDHVVTTFDVGEAEGTPFLAMELLQGKPLDEVLKRAGTISIPQAVRIACETALGLAAAHERGLIHRDIKPANIWLESPTGRVKILDFGLARGEDDGLTGTGLVVGTPAYMSPEQARGESVNARSDLFSLGAVLYRLLTGRQPFTGNSPTVTLLAVQRESPVDVRQLNPDVPEALARLVAALLAKDPAKRPAAASVVAAQLALIGNDVAGATMPAVDPLWADVVGDSGQVAIPQYEQEPAARAWWLALGGAAVGVLLLVGVVLVWALSGPLPAKHTKDIPKPPVVVAPPVREQEVKAPPVEDGLSATDVLTSPNREWAARRLLANVNSPGEEFGPGLSADGLILVFSSRRDRLPLLRLYEARRDSTDVPFGTPILIGSSDESDVNEMMSWLSADGLTAIYLVRAKVMFVRRESRDAPWGKPVEMILPSLPERSFPSSLAMSPDGLNLYVSCVKIGGKQSALWVYRRPKIDAAWQTPVELGPGVNVAERQEKPRPLSDGRGVLFVRIADPDVQSKVTVHVAVLGADGEVVAVRELPPPKGSTSWSNTTYWPSADGRTLYFPFGNGENKTDLWEMRLVPKDDAARDREVAELLLPRWRLMVKPANSREQPVEMGGTLPDGSFTLTGIERPFGSPAPPKGYLNATLLPLFHCVPV